jgi:hypothetical protein
MNIGQLITYLVLNSNKSNEEIVAIVHTKFKCKTTVNCVTWYKTKLRKEGHVIKGNKKHHVVIDETELQKLCD